MEKVGKYVYEKKDLIGHGAFAIVFKGSFKEVSVFMVFYTLLCVCFKSFMKFFCDNAKLTANRTSLWRT